MKRKIGVWTGYCCGIILSMISIASVNAQVLDHHWTAPIRLSSGEGRANQASLLSDEFGNVHAFWIETDLPDNRSIIQYARFNGEFWSAAIDVFASSQIIRDLSAAIDQDGTLYLIWTQGGAFRQRPIYYAYARVVEAGSARNWSIPLRLDIEAHLIRLKVDSAGTIHILYSNFFDRPGVYYIRSDSQGNTWSDPVWLDPDIPRGYGPDSIQFALGEKGLLHAVWFYTSIDAGVADWVRYAHSLDGGISWSVPFTIDKDTEGSGKLRAASPIMIAQDRNVHVVWAAGTLNYRNHRFSVDAGRSWSLPERVFGDLNGQAFDDLAIDDTGRVHFFGQLRYPQGIYHASWERNHWVGPFLIYLISEYPGQPIGERIHAHRLRAAVRVGNQIVLTFTDSPSDPDSQLYVMVRTLEDIQPILTKPLPEPALGTRISATPSPILKLLPTSTSSSTPILSTTSPVTFSTGFNLWLGVVSAALFLFAFFIVYALRRR